MENFSKISILYPTHIVVNKRKLEKKQAPIPLDWPTPPTQCYICIDYKPLTIKQGPPIESKH